MELLPPFPTDLRGMGEEYQAQWSHGLFLKMESAHNSTVKLPSLLEHYASNCDRTTRSKNQDCSTVFASVCMSLLIDVFTTRL